LDKIPENPGKTRENLGKIYENFRKIPEELGKQPENTSKNGDQRCLIMKNPACAESQEGLFLEVIAKEGVNDLCGRKYSHKVLLENFSGKCLGKFGQKYFAPETICLLHLWILLHVL